MRLADFLRTQGVARKDFAAAVAITPGMLSRILAGGARPSPALMLRIHTATGGAVTPNDLVLPAPGAAAA